MEYSALNKENPHIDFSKFDKPIALFLDLDGTVLDFAKTSDQVVVPDGLIETLDRLQRALNSALAIVSGRPLSEIDHLMAPLKLAAAGEHGILVRTVTGQEIFAELPPLPAEVIAEAQAVERKFSGAHVEVKSASLVLHYRLCPDYQEELHAVAMKFATAMGPLFGVIPAVMAWEIRALGVNKGSAVAKLMEDPPFIGRIPVFIGDDVTDIDGCRAAQTFGGLGLMVGETFPDGPAGVRLWLTALADTMAPAEC